MIHVVVTPLTSEQVLKIQNWLKEEPGEMYRSVLAANIAALQADAGRNLIEAKSEANQQGDAANEKADEAIKYVHALDIFDAIASGRESLIRTSVFTEPPVKIAETT